MWLASLLQGDMEGVHSETESTDDGIGFATDHQLHQMVPNDTRWSSMVEGSCELYSTVFAPYLGLHWRRGGSYEAINGLDHNRLLTRSAAKHILTT